MNGLKIIPHLRRELNPKPKRWWDHIDDGDGWFWVCADAECRGSGRTMEIANKNWSKARALRNRAYARSKA